MAGDEVETTPQKVEDRIESVEKTPYTLPEDAQLLAYWHYKKSADVPPDKYVIFHKNIETQDVEDEILAAGQPDESALLVKELRGGGKRGRATRTSFSKIRYTNDVRQLSRWRLLLGQKRDACIQLDQQFDIERRKLVEIKYQLKECEEALESFLANEHSISMSLLHKAETERTRTLEMSEQRDALSRRYGQARLEVYHWEESWRTVRACHRFLLRISPLTGRESADFLFKQDHRKDNSSSSNEGDEEEEKNNNNHNIGDYDEADHGETGDSWESPLGDFTSSGELGHAASLQSLIAAFEREANNLPELPSRTPEDLALYKPDDLMRIFRAIELQNLSALLHLESLGGPMADMLGRIDEAEGRVRREIEDVLGDIERLEGAIVREERRARRLERYCGQLVQRGFRALICSEEALKARALVEDAYETCVAANEAGLEPLAMARGLESAYERLSAQLDLLPQQLVAVCEREGFLRELKDSREAEDAARKFELMHRLLAALRRMMEPSEPKRRRLVRRSPPKRRGPGELRKSKALANNETLTARDAHLGLFEKGCGKGTYDFEDDESIKSAD